MPKFAQPINGKEALKPKKSISKNHVSLPSPTRVAWGLRLREEPVFLTLVIPRAVSVPQRSKQIIEEVSGALCI